MLKTEILSPGGDIRAEISLETFWQTDTIYPAAAVLRLFFRNHPLTTPVALEFQPRGVGYALCFESVRTEAKETRFGPAVQLDVALRSRDCEQPEYLVTLRLSDVSVFFKAHCRGDSIASHAVLPVLSEQAAVVSLEGEQPTVAYVGTGALAALWQRDDALHLVLFKRAGELAEQHFNVPCSGSLPLIQSGADATRSVYVSLPFINGAVGQPQFGPQVRSTLVLAFSTLLEHYRAQQNDDDFVILRGEPGVFVVFARRCGQRWIVGALTAGGRTLCFRFEDLWRRLPAESKFRSWRVQISRDPVLDETGEIYRESFNAVAPDLRLFMELRRNGGFVLEFEPEPAKVSQQ